MAKALLGGVGRIDPRMIAEMRRLQHRVADLESELLRLRAENDSLQAALSREELLVLPAHKEPALA
jgi:hypothetical protein